jgi:hypothetical protein
MVLEREYGVGGAIIGSLGRKLFMEKEEEWDGIHVIKRRGLKQLTKAEGGGRKSKGSESAKLLLRTSVPLHES